MAKIAFVFPGQGSASVGMGVQIIEQSPEAARVMDQVAVLLPALMVRPAKPLDDPRLKIPPPE